MVRIGEISAYWQKPTVAPVVQVDSPEAAENIRRLYPYDHPRFVYDWQRSMSGMSEIAGDLPAYLMGSLAAFVMGAVGWQKHRNAEGIILLGASGSLFGAVAYNFIRDITK